MTFTIWLSIYNTNWFNTSIHLSNLYSPLNHCCGITLPCLAVLCQMRFSWYPLRVTHILQFNVQAIKKSNLSDVYKHVQHFECHRELKYFQVSIVYFYFVLLLLLLCIKSVFIKTKLSRKIQKVNNNKTKTYF